MTEINAGRSRRLGTLAAGAMLAIALAMPAQQAAAQDPLIGGILGGAAGAVIGGAAGGRQGAAIGAIIGATAGAVIAAEGQRRGSYYYWNGGCYRPRPPGYVVVAPHYCGPVYGPRVYGPPPVPANAIAWCARRYRSYDPYSQTYLGYDGFRHRCP